MKLPRYLTALLLSLATAASAQSLRVTEVRVEGKTVETAVTVTQFTPPQRTPAPLQLQTGQTLTDGVEIAVPARTVIVLQSANGNRIELAPDARFTAGRVSANGEAHTLNGGNARFDVQRALSFFNIEFNRFVALVRGTVFDAEAGAGGEGALEVREGRVAVQREVPTLMQDTGNQVDMLEQDLLDAKTQPRGQWPASEAVRRYTHSDEALQQYTTDLKRAEQTRDRDGQLTALNNMGLAWLARGDARTAMVHFKRMLALAQSGQDDPWRARALNNLGAAALEMNDDKSAVQYLENALTVNYALAPQSVQRRVAQAEGNLGIAWRRLGDLDKARDYTERSLQANLQLAQGRDSAAVARNLESLGHLAADAATALQQHQRALEMRQRLFADSANPEVASSHMNLGLYALRSGDDHAAAAHYGRAVAIYEALFAGRNHASLANALTRQAVALCRSGNVEPGLAHAERALAMRQALKPRPVDPDVVDSLNQIAACWTHAVRLEQYGAKEKMLEALQRLKAYQASGKPEAS